MPNTLINFQKRNVSIGTATDSENNYTEKHTKTF